MCTIIYMYTVSYKYRQFKYLNVITNYRLQIIVLDKLL